MLDQLNDQLIRSDERPIYFEHDCREGICGSCGFLVNGQAHGSQRATTICQLYVREFQDGETVTLEPWRAAGFPLLQDLAVERSALDRIIAAGGYCSINTGQAPDGNAMLIGQEQALSAFETATCIGCGACVASCRNASASLFTAAKLAHLGQLPQDNRTALTGAFDAGRDGAGRIRELQQQSRMRSRLPERDFSGLDQLDERRSSLRAVSGTRGT